MRVEQFRSLLWAVCCYLLFMGFSDEIVAVGSHVFHPSPKHLGAYTIPVPLSWLGMSDDGGWRFTMFKDRGWIRNRVTPEVKNAISFSLQPGYPTGVELLDPPKREIFDRLVGETSTVSERTVAGIAYVCVRRFHKDFAEVAEIDCSPKFDRTGMQFSFIGDAHRVPEFFAILDGVKKAN